MVAVATTVALRAEGVLLHHRCAVKVLFVIRADIIPFQVLDLPSELIVAIGVFTLLDKQLDSRIQRCPRYRVLKVGIKATLKEHALDLYKVGARHQRLVMQVRRMTYGGVHICFDRRTTPVSAFLCRDNDYAVPGPRPPDTRCRCV